jgi:cell division protein FtsN
MPKIEPGLYEPSDDVRVFDDADEADEEGSRLPLLIVIALLVLAAFGGVLYLAYIQGVQRGRADAPRPVASATATSGSETPYKGLKIYEQPAPADQDTADEDSAPQPPTETAKAAPPATAMQFPPAAATRMAPPPATTQSATTPPHAETTTKSPQQLAAIAPKPKPVEPALAASALVVPPSSELVATVPDASPGSYVLQIGSYKSQDEADASWKTYQAKHPMLGGYESDVKKADLGDKGVWYRLRVGSFATKDAASTLCDKLKVDGGDCLLAKR